MSDIKKEKIINAIKGGMPVKEVASKLFMTEKQLRLLLNNWGYEPPRKRRYRKVELPERNSLMSLYQKYRTTQRVADHFGVGINTVNKWMRSLNIPTRKMKLGREDKIKLLEGHIDVLDVRL